MRKYTIAVLGATGAVGSEMLKVLEEYEIPVGNLLPLAGPKSAGKTVFFKGKEILTQEATDASFAGCDFVLGAANSKASRRFAPAIVKSGAIYIDNSSAFRMESDVPLVVPEINGNDVFQNKGIIANPNCSSTIALLAVAGIHRLSPIESIVASAYQAVSGAGQKGLKELDEELEAYVAGKKIKKEVFPAQIAMNVIPKIGDDLPNLYTDEEMKMQNEGRRILHDPSLRVSCTCVRVPVMRSHCISLRVKTKGRITVEEAKDSIRAFPGCALATDFEGRDYPTPLDAAGQDLVLVGRVREDLTDENGLCLWCCGDQLRKGAAANAVQILKLLLTPHTSHNTRR